MVGQTSLGTRDIIAIAELGIMSKTKIKYCQIKE